MNGIKSSKSSNNRHNGKCDFTEAYDPKQPLSPGYEKKTTW